MHVRLTRNGQISRTQSFLLDHTTSANNVEAILNVRDVLRASTIEPKPFAFSTVFIFTEQVQVLYP